MRLLQFLKYEKPYIYLYVISFFIFGVLFFTDPKVHWQWNTFLYGLLLNTLIFVGFFLYRYYQNIQAIKNINQEEYENISFEGQYYATYMEEMEKEHLHKLNHIQMKQREYYDFIVSWFHEIKTPISVLRLMEQTELDAKSVREEIAKIEHYVDQALYYAKLDNFNQDYEIQNCNLEKITKEIIKGHSKTFISKRIKVQLSLQPMDIQSDPKWLKFILNQLITNSLKYTNYGGELAISTKETAREKQLLIQDNGIGITKEDLPRIFNRGFTGANGRTYTKSTGMGLYLAQELSHKLGHYITCESEISAYTIFTIHFPKNTDPYFTMTNKNATSS